VINVAKAFARDEHCLAYLEQMCWPGNGQLTGGHYRNGFGECFVCKSSSHCESVELVARLNPADLADAVKPHRVGNQIESWQSKLNLNIDVRRWTYRRQDKHSALPYVSAVANVVMFYAVGPAEQDGQDYLESAGGSPLYRMIHTALGMSPKTTGTK
jgi:hypothetical protein